MSQQSKRQRNIFRTVLLFYLHRNLKRLWRGQAAEEEETPPVEEEPVGENPPAEEPEEENPVDEEPVDEQDDTPPVEDDEEEDTPPEDDGSENENPTPEPDGGNVTDPDLTGNDDNEIDGAETVTAIETDPAISIAVYPNPTNSENIIISLQGLQTDYSIHVIDMLGAVRFHKNYSSKETQATLQNLHLKDGMYSIVISSGGIRYTKRLMIRGN